MSFVLAIILIIVFLLFVANDSASIATKRENYKKEFPPCKLQEEYLLSCEYYYKYLMEGRNDAFEASMHDARKKIWEDGYLPSSLENGGMSLFQKAEECGNLYKSWRYCCGPYEMKPTCPPISHDNTSKPGERQNALGVAAWRDEDASPYNVKGLRIAKYPDPASWKKYCEWIDGWYEDIVVNVLVSSGVVTFDTNQNPCINMEVAKTKDDIPDFYYALYGMQSKYETILRKHSERLSSFKIES